MKLRNKKTGEIIDLDIANIKAQFGGISVIPLPIKQGGDEYVYNSLAELNEEWEDCNGYYYIGDGGDVNLSRTKYRLEYEDKAHEEIGNYFETREEAEKAVERLRAWKRLKDKDFQFHGHNALGVGEITFSLDFEDMDDEGEIGQLRHDLDLLFGGEK